jgi:hypothetical protein
MIFGPDDAPPAPDIERICRDCGQAFALGSEAVDTFRRRDLHLPLRCVPCRILKRQRNGQPARGIC